MKKLLTLALAACALAACAPKQRTVVILATNDMHSHIETFPRLASAVEACRDTVGEVLLVDAGDRWTGNVYNDAAAEPRKPVIDMMNALGYDVATFGNHEFDPGQAFLNVRTQQAAFEVVCANLVSDTLSFLQPEPYALVDFDGLKIAFVGCVTNYDRNNHPAGKDECFAGLRFTDAVETTAEWGRRLRPECDVLVALTHMGTERDRQLAEAAPEFDVVIGGHSHDETDERVGDVLLTQTGKYLKNVGAVVLRMRGGEIVSKEYRNVPLAGYEPHPDFRAMADRCYDEPALKEPVAELGGTFAKPGLANLFAEAVRAGAKADVGMYHLGGVRLDSLAGTVSVADLYNLDPFRSEVLLLTMTPEQLERVVMAKFNDRVNLGESHRIDLWMTTPYVVETDGGGDAVRVRFPRLKSGRTYRVAVGDYVVKSYAGLEYGSAQGVGRTVSDAIGDYLRAHAPALPQNECLQRIVPEGDPLPVR